MSSRQAQKRAARELVAMISKPPEWAPMPEYRDIMAWICLGCWDGTVPVPPFRDGMWVDVGIDLFYEDAADGGVVQPVKRNHVCPANKYILTDPSKAALLAAMFPNGNWHKQVLRISQISYDKLIASGAKAGSPTIDPR